MAGTVQKRKNSVSNIKLYCKNHNIALKYIQGLKMSLPVIGKCYYSPGEKSDQFLNILKETDKVRTQTERKRGKVMGLLTRTSDLMMQRSMEFLWTKQSCILDNIANVETPGYKTKYATFEESLEEAIRSASQTVGGGSASIRQAIADTAIQVREAEESTRMDDNGVNITEQSVELARNGYQLQYVMNAISSDFARLRAAITG